VDISKIIDAVIAREGGYVNNPDDRGGATNFGITQAVARAQGYAADMRDMPRDEAVSIYTRLYWLKPKLDQIANAAPELAAKLFDIAVNMGPATAIGFLKRALNVMNRMGKDFANLAPVPIIDDATLTALNAFLEKRGAAGTACGQPGDLLGEGNRGALRVAAEEPAHPQPDAVSASDVADACG